MSPTTTTAVGEVHVTAADSSPHTVRVRHGARLMPALKSAKVGVIGMCGGNAACGTCHVYLPSAWWDALGEPGPDEQEMLDELDSATPNSRLACQIRFDDTVDGIELTVAPHD